jgi:hypothetical protein
MKKIYNIFLAVLLFAVPGINFANTGIAYIENPQVNGLVFSWELHFERTGEWTDGFFKNALGGSAASFDYNNSSLTNATVLIESGGPLDNANYIVTVHLILDKCIVDIPFSLQELEGVLPLNEKVKLLTVFMDITDIEQTAELSWDALNTGFFDNFDQNVITDLVGASNIPLPVELTSFAALYQNSAVLLQWTTETEINNYGFNVERRVGEGTWDSIAFIGGHGNSNSPKEYSYSDNDIYAGGSNFQYRLKQIDTDGVYEYTDIVQVEIIPAQFELSQNYPNPFNPTTTIRFSLPEPTQLKINIYNILGEQVKTIAEGIYETGYYKVTFDATSLPSGTYIYRLESNEFVETKKMILIK